MAVTTFPHISSFSYWTASLDTETETALMGNLKRVGQGRTTIIIAHRLSTIQDCDEIVVMDQGRVVEQGTHEELIHRGGRYTELLQMQETNNLGDGEGGGDT